VDVDVIIESLPLYGQGALVTLALLVLSLGIGLLFALPLAMLRSLPSPWVWRPIWAYTYVIRGTPMLLQLFLLYYGLAQFEAVRESVFWPWLRSAWFCSVAAFAINTCAYTTEILHGAMRSLPGGEIEAAKALGMSRWVTFRRIVLPSAFRRALPAYGNEVVLMLHGTSLASVVTLVRPHRCGTRGELALLPAVRGLHHRRRLLPADHGRAGGDVPRRREALAATAHRPLLNPFPIAPCARPCTPFPRPPPAASTRWPACTTAPRAAGPKVYIQASLHADEVPGMLVAHHLRGRLAELEAQGCFTGEVVLVPAANPIGLAQRVLHGHQGRFDLASGENFNRQFTDLTEKVAARVQGRLGSDAAANVALVRVALGEAIAEMPGTTPLQALRRLLMGLAADADVVLDLHCDGQAVLHFYTTPATWPQAGELLARCLGAEAVLLAERSGGDPFDEACSMLWPDLARRLGPAHPLPPACLAATIELRGEADVTHPLARRDAEAIVLYLHARGVIHCRLRPSCRRCAARPRRWPARSRSTRHTVACWCSTASPVSG
jgi:His/Glu/Gln/Arg/opine family amino acid ABC transporter permease subunit